MIDKTVRKAPRAKIEIDTPYYQGTVKAICLPNALYDLLIGNIPGAREPREPDPLWGVVESASSESNDNEPIKISINKNGSLKQCPISKELNGKLTTELNLCDIYQDEFIKMQQSEKAIKRPTGKIKLTTENKLIYCTSVDQQGNIGHKQLFIPRKLCHKVMELTHDNKFSRHMGIKKTQDIIQICFYWPKTDSEIRRYCKSCIVCQKTLTKGCSGAPVP